MKRRRRTRCRKAGRIDDADAPPALNQALDNAFRGVGLARPGLAENGQVPFDHHIEHGGRARRHVSTPSRATCYPSPVSSARLTVYCTQALRLMPRRLAAASTRSSRSLSNRIITGVLRVSACSGDGAPPAPAMNASAAFSGSAGCVFVVLRLGFLAIPMRHYT